MDSSFHHIPVLFQETIEALFHHPAGIYADCTAGGGGHSAALAARLEGGRLLAIDRDPQAIAALQRRFASEKQVTVIHRNFFDIKAILREQGVAGLDGALADLGVSSHQLDTAQRGFSYHDDAPLDMRMSIEGQTAAQAVNTLPMEVLRDIFFRFGEEKFAPSIARAIVREREKQPIETTLQLAELIKFAVPAAVRRENGHPARRVFQALRIYINGELDGLGQALDDLFDSLNPGGRLAILTFHSLEDRIVKQRFAALCTGCTCPPQFPVCVCGVKPRARQIVKSAAAGKQELEENPRARSARLRVIEKIG